MQASATLQGLSLSQSFGQTRDTTRGQRFQSVDGQSLVSSHYRDYQVQGSLQYQRVDGHLKLNSWGVTGNRQTATGMNYRGGVRGAGGGLKEASWFLNAMRQSGRFAYGGEFAYARSTGYSVGLRVQVSLGREPRTGRWITDAQSMTGTGAVSALAFLDGNYNGRRDPGERSIEGVRFLIAQAEPPDRRPSPTVALYTHLGSGNELDLEVDTTSLEESSQQPALPRFAILPRPGTFMAVDYPIVVLGELNGTTRVRREGGSAELAGLEIELTKAGGERVKAQRSAYDGFFEFRDLFPGTYRLRVTPREVKRLGLKEPPERVIQIDPSKTVFEGQDLVVEFERADQAQSIPPPDAAIPPPSATSPPLGPAGPLAPSQEP